MRSGPRVMWEAGCWRCHAPNLRLIEFGIKGPCQNCTAPLRGRNLDFVPEGPWLHDVTAANCFVGFVFNGGSPKGTIRSIGNVTGVQARGANLDGLDIDIS